MARPHKELPPVGPQLKRMSASPWRVIEAQHIIGTRKLVDSDRDHAILEDLLEARKPPPGPDCRHLHYLLFTPFRYPPLRYGSRFGGRADRGIWYGADKLSTGLAEVAYYRLVFLEGSKANLAPLSVELSAFQARVVTTRGVDLSRPPFDGHRAALASPSDYRTSQRLGATLRAEGAEAFRYFSARDPAGGTCIGVISPKAFADKRPTTEPQSWYSVATRESVEFRRKNFFEPLTFRFERALFEVGGELPHPAT